MANTNRCLPIEARTPADHLVSQRPVCVLGGSDGDDTAKTLRTQLLLERLWLSECRAELIAGLIWGARE